MSSLLVLFFFGVDVGRHISQQKPASREIYHCFYSTSFPAASDAEQRYPAEIRIYSPYNNIVLPDNTVVFLVAKGYFALHETMKQQHLSLYLVCDPADTSYDNNVPDLTTPLIIGLDVVPSCFDILADGKLKMCMVLSSDYVRDVQKQSSIQYIHFTFFASLTYS
ncbi:hypothetical protein L210DRAFT_3388333 [Boletus edulis BED1]|uniref:Uncharacterized protein n=1 Tax=Boletus edulis BED1 TaxID=1328754 RepID=A0AAD4C5F3_BOLED|nr:hypothetical protein L210DRAFT_3388333 [Boletus edulis BED1]